MAKLETAILSGLVLFIVWILLSYTLHESGYLESTIAVVNRTRPLFISCNEQPSGKQSVGFIIYMYFSLLCWLLGGAGRATSLRAIDLLVTRLCTTAKLSITQHQGCNGAGTRRSAVPANIFEPERLSGNIVYHRRNADTGAFRQISSGRGPVYYDLPKC